MCPPSQVRGELRHDAATVHHPTLSALLSFDVACGSCIPAGNGIIMCACCATHAGCIQVVTLLKAAGGGQLSAEWLQDAVQQRLPADMQLRAFRLVALPAVAAAQAADDVAGPGGVWCQPVAFPAAAVAVAAAAAVPAADQALTLHVPPQLLAATAAAGRGVRVVVCDSATLVLDQTMGADDDAAWSADGSLRLQLPPCEGPLVLLHLLSTAGAAAAGEHAADVLLATAALLALPEQAACSEVNRLFEVMQQKLEPAGQSQGDGSALSAAPLVFNSQLRAFVLDYGHLLAPGRRASPQLTRHLQTFLALQDMHSCLQLLRSAGVTVNGQQVAAAAPSSDSSRISNGRAALSHVGELPAAPFAFHCTAVMHGARHAASAARPCKARSRPQLARIH